MERFVEGEDRYQSTLFPETLDDYVAEENPVRVIEAFIDELDLSRLGLRGCRATSHWQANLSSFYPTEDLC